MIFAQSDIYLQFLFFFSTVRIATALTVQAQKQDQQFTAKFSLNKREICLLPASRNHKHEVKQSDAFEINVSWARSPLGDDEEARPTCNPVLHLFLLERRILHSNDPLNLPHPCAAPVRGWVEFFVIGVAGLDPLCETKNARRQVLTDARYVPHQELKKSTAHSFSFIIACCKQTNELLCYYKHQALIIFLRVLPADRFITNASSTSKTMTTSRPLGAGGCSLAGFGSWTIMDFLEKNRSKIRLQLSLQL